MYDGWSMSEEWFMAMRTMPLHGDAGGRDPDVVFGGWTTSMVDLAAVVAGLLDKGFPKAVSVSVQVDLISPVLVGDVVTFFTRQVAQGERSITLEVSVEVFRTKTKTNFARVAKGRVVVVPVDEHGKSLLVANFGGEK